jgi:signal transduction histidine kinase
MLSCYQTIIKVILRQIMEIELEKIYKASLKLLMPILPDETYKIIVDEAIKLVDADSGVIYLFSDSVFKPVYASAPILYEIKPRRGGNNYKAFTKKKPIIAPISDIGKAHPELKSRPIGAAIFIPLSYGNKSIGVLTLNTRDEKKFNEKTSRILVLFGSMISLAIRKAQHYEETQKALKERDQFVSMAAHELRTPLTSIHGYIQLLQTKNHRDKSEIRWLDQLYFQSTRMTHLVNELLEINKIQSNKFEYNFQEISIKEAIERVLHDFKAIHPERNIIFIDRRKYNVDITVADYNKISQVLINLIDNAIKFSNHNTQIVVELLNTKKEYFIQIKDQGLGIPEGEIDKISEPYYRGKDHAKEGLGIGLFLVKSIINQHNGYVKIRSKVNKGTTVKVSLPRHQLC